VIAPRSFLAGLAALSFVAVALPGAAVGAARPVALSGALDRFTRPSLGALEVMAVSANDGTLAGVVAARGGAYRLSVPAGPYLVQVQDENFRSGTIVGLSDVVSVGGAGGLIPVAPGGPPALAATATATATAPIIAISPMTVTAAEGSGLRSGSMQGQVISAIFDRCHGTAHYRLIDADPALQEALKREQQLKDQGRIMADFAYNPATPAYAITGSGTVDANGNVVVELSLIDLASGKTLDHVRGRGDAKDIDALIRRFGRGLAERDCHDNEPPGPVHRKPHKKKRSPIKRHGSGSAFTATYEGDFEVHNVSDDKLIESTTQIIFNSEITVHLSHGVVVATSRTLTAQGTLDFSGPGYAGGNAHCTLSASGPTTLPMSITPNPSRPGGPLDRLIIGVHVPASIGVGQLSIAGDPGCNTNSGTLYPMDNEADWSAAVAPGPTVKIADFPFSTHYPVNDNYHVSGGTQTVTLTDTLTVR
jgi:hypothetical protein